MNVRGSRKYSVRFHWSIMNILSCGLNVDNFERINKLSKAYYFSLMSVIIGDIQSASFPPISGGIKDNIYLTENN